MLTFAVLLLAQTVSAGTAEPWRTVFEGQPGVVAVSPVSGHPRVDLRRPLFDCPRLPDIPAREVAAFNLKIDVGSGRRTDIDVWIAELPAAYQAMKQVEQAGS